MLTAGLQKTRLLFGLAEKHRKHTFLAKNSHITKTSAKCVAKSVNHLSWKHVKCRSQQLLIEPDQYIGDCKSARADLIIRKKTVCCMCKCDSVQYRFRQHGSLFAASRKFCGGLTACLFLVVFRLAVNIFGGFAATSAKIGLGGYATAKVLYK